MLLILASLFLAGQSWYEVSMSPNDEVVTLKSFDGFTAYAWLSPILLVCLAAVAVAVLLSGIGSRVILGFGFLVSCLVAFLVARSVTTQDLGGVTKELESATGIAATHGITGLQIQTTQFAFLSLSTLLAVAGYFLYTLLSHKTWAMKSSSRTPRNGVGKTNGQIKSAGSSSAGSSKPKPASNDSIAIWDEQR